MFAQRNDLLLANAFNTICEIKLSILPDLHTDSRDNRMIVSYEIVGMINTCKNKMKDLELGSSFE